MNLRHVFVPLLLVASASVAFAQTPKCQVLDPEHEFYPATPLPYPTPSNQYAVQYKLGGVGWTDAQVYISEYGGTMASPYHTYSGYPQDITSMSFASIPATAKTTVALRVTKLSGAGFPTIDHVSVRPGAKGIRVDSVSSETVELSAKTAEDFAGEQFILWWDGDTQQSGAIQGLAFFLDPPYHRPSGSNVKTISRLADLLGDDLPKYDTLDFEGILRETDAHVFSVPPNIRNVFLGPGSWVPGKMRFEQTGDGQVRRLYGPGVLDASRFDYSLRQCRKSYVLAEAEQGYQALSWTNPPKGAAPDKFLLDGIIIADYNYYATASLVNSVVNNVKIIGWNGNNDGFQFGQGTSASNVFVRTGDDSLKMWGSSVTVTNATVWQNFNGGVVNLGWSDNSPGDDGLIDGLYVVKTDWHTPVDPSWTADTLLGELNGQNNAIIASMMGPGTQFGALHPSVYRNIYVEDAPRVLFSLRILPHDCGLNGLLGDPCPYGDMSQRSELNLHIENVFTPASVLENSIGFQTLPHPTADGYANPDGSTLPDGYTLTGCMHIIMKHVFLTLPDGTLAPLTRSDAGFAGKMGTNGDDIDIDYHGDEDDQVSGWFSAWTAAQGYHPLVPSFPVPMTDSSVRMIVRPNISGTAVRVKIENTVGRYPVTFSAAYIGQVQSGAAVVPASNKQLTFNNGSPGLTLAPGAGAYSDPMPFSVTPFTRYAISLDVSSALDISGHELGLVTNYIASRAHAADPSGDDFTTIPNPPLHDFSFPSYWVAAVDVASASNSGTVVAIGDSITDGKCSTANSVVEIPDVYNRWTDLLAARFAGLPPSQSKAVVNEGIAGNTVFSNDGLGPPALVRGHNDALFREGVTHVIFFEGTNDIANDITDGATPASEIARLVLSDDLIIDRAHTAGLRIIGATIIPRGGEGGTINPNKWTYQMEQVRTALNDWIRHQANFDGVIDFDTVMQGPPSTTGNNAVTLPKKWSCYDNVHPNADGYAAMAAHIDLSLFRARRRESRR